MATLYTERHYQNVVRPRKEGLHSKMDKIYTGADVRYINGYLNNEGSGTTLEGRQEDGTIGGNWGHNDSHVALFELELGVRIIQCYWSCSKLDAASSFVGAEAQIGLGNRDGTNRSYSIISTESTALEISDGVDVDQQPVTAGDSGILWNEGSDVEVLDPIATSAYKPYVDDERFTIWVNFPRPVVASVSGYGHFSFGILYCL